MYVNLVSILALALHTKIPSYLSIILSFVVVPIVFWGTAHHILSKKLNVGFVQNDVTAGIVSATTIWIGLTIGLTVGVYDYFKLSAGGVVSVATIDKLPENIGAAYIEIDSVVIQPDLVGINDDYTYRSGGKTRNQYRTIPVASYPPGARRLFVGLHNVDGEKDADLLVMEYSKKVLRDVKGIVVKSPYTMAQYDHAILDGQERTKYKLKEPYFVLDVGKNYYSLLQKYLEHIYIFVGIMNLIWFLIPCLIILF